MNIEYVYQILLGANFFLESRIFGRESNVKAVSKLKIQNEKNKTRIMFSDAKIRDIGKWDVDRKESNISQTNN